MVDVGVLRQELIDEQRRLIVAISDTFQSRQETNDDYPPGMSLSDKQMS